MHEDLKALLRAGWTFGLRYDRDREAFLVAAKPAEGDIARGAAAEPLEALARAILEAQSMEAKQ